MKSSWDDVKDKCLVNANKCLEAGLFEDAERLLYMALGIHNAFIPGMQGIEELVLEDSNGRIADPEHAVVNRSVVLNFDTSCLDNVEVKIDCLNRKASQLRESLAEILSSISSLNGLFK